MSDETKREYYVVGRGFAGWHAKGINLSSSGGTLEDRTWFDKNGPQRQAGYLSSAVDGALIYDADGADSDAFITFVYRGPMCDPALPPGTVNRLWEGSKPCTPGDALTARGLDSVSVDLYRHLLKQVPGVKIGTITGGVITWEWPEAPRAVESSPELAQLFPIDPRD